MSTQEGQEIIEKWKEELASYEKYNNLSGQWGLASSMAFDAKEHPEIARKLSTMFLNAIDKLDAKKRDSMLRENLPSIKSLGRLDYRILDDVLKFADKREIIFDIDADNCTRDEFIVAMNEGKISPKLLADNLSLDSSDALALCVAKDPSLANDFWKYYKFKREPISQNETKSIEYVDEIDYMFKQDYERRQNFSYEPETLYQLSKQLDKLPEKMTPWLVDEVERTDYWMNWEKKNQTLFNVVRHDPKYLVKFKENGHELLNNKDAEFVAKIYEDLQNRVPDTLTEKDVKKNRPVKVLKDALNDTLTIEEQKLSKTCEDLLKGYEHKGELKIILTKKYPMSAEALGVENSDYVDMFINNLEHPEKENIRSILNRLEATEAETYEDFADAVDFVRRRDMFKKVCSDFNKAKNEEYRKEHDEGNHSARGIKFIDAGQLSYGMAEAGIKDKETAGKVVELFFKMNERPATYNSPYNNFYPQDLKDMTDLEEWMYPVIQRAVRDGVVAPSRLGGGKDLFAACKAWNINPKMPKAIAEQVGEMSLAKRMVAGAIVDDMARAQIKTLKENNPDNYVIQGASWISEDSSYFANVKAGMNHNKELIPEFWKEMSKAQEMSFGEAMKTYIPDTPINRKRFVAAMLEEMGVENTEAKYQQTYKNLEENGKFEEFLASDSKEQKLERIKQNKAKVQEKSTKKKSIREAIRERLAKKNIIPETGAFGEGHKITANKDMSQFKAFVDEKSR